MYSIQFLKVEIPPSTPSNHDSAYMLGGIDFTSEKVFDYTSIGETKRREGDSGGEGHGAERGGVGVNNACKSVRLVFFYYLHE